MNPHGQPLWAIHVGPPWSGPVSTNSINSQQTYGACRLHLEIPEKPVDLQLLQPGVGWGKTPQTLGCDPVAWFEKTIPVSRFGDVRSASQPDTVSLVSLVTPKIDRKKHIFFVV